MKNDVNVKLFVKNLVKALAHEQENSFFFDAFDRYYPFANEDLTLINGGYHYSESDVKLGEMFNFRIPLELKEAMYSFRKNVKIAKNLLESPNDFSMTLKSVEISIDEYGIVGAKLTFSWGTGGYNTSCTPMVMEWQKSVIGSNAGELSEKEAIEVDAIIEELRKMGDSL